MKKMYMLFIFATCLPYAMEAATVVWQGNNPTNVTDTDVILKGKITLPPIVTNINAVNTDVTIRLEDSPEVCNSPTGSSFLSLNANTGRTITIKVKNDALKFRSQNNYSINFNWNGGGNVIVVEEK